MFTDKQKDTLVAKHIGAQVRILHIDNPAAQRWVGRVGTIVGDSQGGWTVELNVDGEYVHVCHHNLSWRV